MAMDKDFLDEYIKTSEPDKIEKSYAWSTAIGLQAVDGLKPSKYLIETAKKNIDGDISLVDANKLIDNYYYIERPGHSLEDRTEQADKVSARLATILSEKSFSFTINEYISIHKKLFNGIYDYAGKIRDYNITKNEWVLNGDTVYYGDKYDLRETLEYDFKEERNFEYKNLPINEVIKHLAKFVSRLWQIRIFGEGNTRTTAVFFIKYLKTLGFKVTNDIFSKNSWYFRNALVRANYTNIEKGIYETTEYLDKFLRNLLLHERNELKNRELHIDQNLKVDIEDEKVDIDNAFDELKGSFSFKTVEHIKTIFKEYGYDKIFARKEVISLINVKESQASKFLSNLLKMQIIESVSGYGKGKYKFKKID